MHHKRRRQRRSTEQPELNVTPFMNLMIVLTPVLLLSLVFTHTTVMDLDFPPPNATSTSVSETSNFYLEVQIQADRLIVADGRSIIKTIPLTPEQAYDYAELAILIRTIKKRSPSERAASVLLRPDTDYQTLVSVMDVMRSYPTLVENEEVEVELFPALSLGDAPVEAARS